MHSVKRSMQLAGINWLCWAREGRGQLKQEHINTAARLLVMAHDECSAPFEIFTVMLKNMIRNGENIGHYRVCVERFSDDDVKEWDEANGKGGDDKWTS